MRGRLLPLLIAAMCLLVVAAASAQTTYQAFLSGLNAVPANASPATGFGTVVLNAAMDQITVNMNWSGLVAPATAAHIHGPANAGQNAAVMFPFIGVLAATAGSIPPQVFAITPTEVGYLQTGMLYMNIHTSIFPGGEIRAQLLAVSEPSSVLSLLCGMTGLGGLALRRRKHESA